MKTIAIIYGMQAAMGLVVAAAGFAMISGADVMVQAFETLGLGASFRIAAGAVELIGGLCLLLPRAGMVGAVLVAGVVVGTAGMTIGQVAGHVLHNGAPGVVATHKAMQTDRFNAARPAASLKDGISI